MKQGNSQDSLTCLNLGEPDFTLSFEELSGLRAPMVYLWTRGEEVLYVGMTHRGLGRPLENSHLQDFQAGDLLKVWRADHPAVIESLLIYHLRPRLNRMKPGDCPKCGAYPVFVVPEVRTNIATEVQSTIAPIKRLVAERWRQGRRRTRWERIGKTSLLAKPQQRPESY